MKHLIILLASTSLVLAACSKDDDGDKKGKGDIVNVNESLQFNPPASEPLTEDQIRALQEINQTSNLADMLLIPENESGSDRQSRENSRRQADENVRRAADQVERDCQLTHPRTQETRTGQGQGMVIMKTTPASIQGNRCPISYDSTKVEKTVFTRLEHNNSEILYGLINVESNAGQNYRITDAQMRQNLSLIESRMQTGSRSTIEISRGNKLKSRSVSDMNGTMLFRNGQTVPVQMHMDIKGQGTTNSSTSDSSEMVMYMQMTYKGVRYVVAMHLRTEGGQTVARKLLLNGRDMTSQTGGDAAPFTPSHLIQM